MVLAKQLNRLLTNCAYVAKQRHMPDVHEVLKAAAVLAGQEYLRDVAPELEKLNKAFEAKLIAGEEVKAEDLHVPPPVEENPEEDFTPLPDEVDEKAEEDFLDELEADFDEVQPN